MARLVADGPDVIASHDGALFALVRGAEVSIHDPTARRRLGSVTMPLDGETEIAFTMARQTRLVTITASDEVTALHAFTLPDLEPITRRDLPGRWRALALAGERLLVVNKEGDNFQVLTLTSKMFVPEGIPLRSPVRLATAAPEERMLVDTRGQLEFWDPDTRRALFRLNVTFASPPLFGGFANRGRLLWLVDAAGHFDVLRFSDGRRQFVMELGGGVVAAFGRMEPSRVAVARRAEGGRLELVLVDLAHRDRESMPLESDDLAFCTVESNEPVLVVVGASGELRYQPLSPATVSARPPQSPQVAPAPVDAAGSADESAPSWRAAVERMSGGGRGGTGEGSESVPERATDRLSAWRSRLRAAGTSTLESAPAVPLEQPPPGEEAPPQEPPPRREVSEEPRATPPGGLPSRLRERMSQGLRRPSATTSSEASGSPSAPPAEPPPSAPVSPFLKREAGRNTIARRLAGGAAAEERERAEARSEPRAEAEYSDGGTVEAPRPAAPRRPEIARREVPARPASPTAAPPRAASPPAAPQPAPGSSLGAVAPTATYTGGWRAALATWAAAALSGQPTAEPPIDDETPLALVARRYRLTGTAARVLALLYAARLLGYQRGLPIAWAANAAGDEEDWLEVLGRGRLADASLVRSRRGRIALRETVARLLDGFAPRVANIFAPDEPGAEPPTIDSPHLLLVEGDEELDGIGGQLAEKLGRAVAVIDLRDDAAARLPRVVDRGLVEASIFDAIAVVLAPARSFAESRRWFAAVAGRPALIAVAGSPGGPLADLPTWPPGDAVG